MSIGSNSGEICSDCEFFRKDAGYARYYCMYPYYKMYGKFPTTEILDCSTWFAGDLRCNKNLCAPEGNWFVHKGGIT